ncbi:hypothetical protein LY474_19535 [Myxococcus stipitatus]|uniref:hypothetical protein n=1 Tax=Myxococcus stipitatus TaxID=83455 RepID=UPI001F431A70|nr:hypothetical protein [Myxococcus stipitatus]MCE9669995.1 hypothetical protein [Myxococcus stipitatus]
MVWKWNACASRVASWRGVLACAALGLTVLTPGRASAELPILSVGLLTEQAIITDILAGTGQMGASIALPFKCTEQLDGLVLETRQRYTNAAISVDAAYWMSASKRYAPMGVVIQLGLHVRTASSDSEDAGLGPSIGLSLTRDLIRRIRDPIDAPGLDNLKAFAGLQGTAVMSPAHAQLQVPVRVSLGLQASTKNLHLMLAGRGGWEDTRLGFTPRPTFDVTFGVGFLDFV